MFGATGVAEETVRCQPVTPVTLSFAAAAAIVQLATHRTNACVRAQSAARACFGEFVNDDDPRARPFVLAR
ncbi:MAG: hypothetical protein FJ137_00960 [Deltaproteobacteria bacterium]|nr:hypothetical protein [Deltaproteobacteria bacterium]